MLQGRYALLSTSALYWMALSSVKENGCAAIPSAIMQEVCHSVSHPCQQSTMLGLLVYILNICEFKPTNTTTD
jgi:hypothetical protein